MLGTHHFHGLVRDNLSAGEDDVIMTIFKVFDPIGLVTVSAAVAAMVYRKQYSAGHHQLLFSLFCSWLVLLVFSILSDFILADVVCYMFAGVGQLLNSAVFLWEVSISVNLLRVIVLGHRISRGNMLVNHWLVWSASLFFTALPMTTSDLGPPSCWINDTSTGSVWRILTFYAPLLAYFVVILLCYTAIGISLCRRRFDVTPHAFSSSGSPKMLSKKSVAYLMLYPLVFMACWFPGVIHRYYQIDTGNDNFGLAVAHAVGQSLHPILSVVVYSWPSIITLAQQLKHRCFPVDDL